MRRRNMLAAALGAAGALAASFGNNARAAAASASAAGQDIAKVAYHLSDLDKVVFVLGNVHHHIEGMGGPDKVLIEVVVHGPALKAFQASSANRDTSHYVTELVQSKVRFHACINTLKGMNLTLGDLLPGFAVAERGGVVLLAELQTKAYAYLRP